MEVNYILRGRIIMKKVLLVYISSIFLIIIVCSILVVKGILHVPYISDKSMYETVNLSTEIESRAAKLQIIVKRLDRCIEEIFEKTEIFNGEILYKEVDMGKEIVWMKVKVPVTEFNNAVKAFENIGKLKYSKMFNRDKTKECIKLQTEMEMLQAAKERLIAVYPEEEESNIQETIRLENKIKHIEKEIKDIRTKIESIEDEIGYGFVYLQINKEPVPAAKYGKMSQRLFIPACKDGLENCMRITAGCIFWILSTMPVWLTILSIWMAVSLMRYIRIKRCRRNLNKVKIGTDTDEG
jgi:translation elongation factor EF-1beta